MRKRQLPEHASAMTPNQIARRYKVGVHKVLHWIASGELRAVNVAADANKRPRWRILPEAIADFERRRAAQPPPPSPRRRRPTTNGVIEFF